MCMLCVCVFYDLIICVCVSFRDWLFKDLERICNIVLRHSVFLIYMLIIGP